MFIAIEGMDGAGKSTQIEMIKDRFLQAQREVVITREPGGTEIGEKIREILLLPENRAISHRTEALLYAASRAQHVMQVIEPALAEGKIVVSDRYVVSSYVYQGIARGLGVEAVRQINDFATGGRMPDLTIFLFVSKEKAMQRKKEQKELDRLEAESLDFHERVNQGFLELAESYPYPKLIVRADAAPEEVHQLIWRRMKEQIDRQEEKR